jgi:hypothetical protein
LPPFKIIIVDDIARSGRHLEEARKYIIECMDGSEDVRIKTAAVTFSDIFNDPIAPDYWYEETRERVRDATGSVD